MTWRRVRGTCQQPAGAREAVSGNVYGTRVPVRGPGAGSEVAAWGRSPRCPREPDLPGMWARVVPGAEGTPASAPGCSSQDGGTQTHPGVTSPWHVPPP